MTATAESSTRTRRPLVGLLVAHAVSTTGNVLTVIALPLYVLTTTGSPALTGVSGFFATAPIVLGGTFGGVLVDRIGHRRSSVLADVVSGATIGMVPLLDVTVGLPFPVLLALVFLSGLLDTPGQTARTALLPDAAELAGMRLERAVALLEGTERGARMIGAPLAGLGVALIGSLSVLALDAASFCTSALVVARFVPAALGGRAEPVEPAGYWRELADGLRFTAREPLLRAVVLLVVVTNMLDAGKSTVLLPVFADRELGGGAAFGLLVGVMAGGALAGSLVFSAIGHRLPRRPVFVVAFALAGVPPMLAMAAGASLPALTGVTLVSGFCAGAINPIIGTVKLERVPPGMRARVYGLIQAGCWAAVPLGSLGAGVAVEQVGLRTTLLVGAGAYLVVTLTPLLGGAWRTMGPLTPAADPGATAPPPRRPAPRRLRGSSPR